MDEVSIHGLAVQCIVGIHPHERVAEQPLRLDLTLGLDTREAARSGKISRTVHYGEVAAQVTALLRFRRYRLLEGAAEEVAWMLLGIHSRIQWLKIRVEKPRALEGLASAASLTITRTREEFVQLAQHEPAAGAVNGKTRAFHVVVREAELAVLQLQAGQPVEAAPLHRRLLWVLGGRVRVEQRLLSAGEHLWEEADAPWQFAAADGEPARVFFCRTNNDLG